LLNAMGEESRIWRDVMKTQGEMPDTNLAKLFSDGASNIETKRWDSYQTALTGSRGYAAMRDSYCWPFLSWPADGIEIPMLPLRWLWSAFL